jgi:hypothetical protein
MTKKHLYSVWNLPNEPLRRGYTGAYHVAKYDRDNLFEEGDAYVVKLFGRNNWYNCSCPGFAHWNKCRHQKIVKVFVDKKKVGSGQLYDYDNERWSNRFVDVPEEED